MEGQTIYLDSSAIVKRYVKEPGSDTVRILYLKAYSGELILSYSIWNIGEVLGVLDRARIAGRLSDKTYRVVRRRFLLETRRMARLGLMIVIRLKAGILKESWRLVEKYYIYEADAVQIASAKRINATRFLTGDEKLHKIAAKEGLNSLYVG